MPEVQSATQIANYLKKQYWIQSRTVKQGKEVLKYVLFEDKEYNDLSDRLTEAEEDNTELRNIKTSLIYDFKTHSNKIRELKESRDYQQTTKIIFRTIAIILSALLIITVIRC